MVDKEAVRRAFDAAIAEAVVHETDRCIHVIDVVGDFATVSAYVNAIKIGATHART